MCSARIHQQNKHPRLLAGRCCVVQYELVDIKEVTNLVDQRVTGNQSISISVMVSI